jgi:hypothetical protein
MALGLRAQRAPAREADDVYSNGTPIDSICSDRDVKIGAQRFP